MKKRIKSAQFFLGFFLLCVFCGTIVPALSSFFNFFSDLNENTITGNILLVASILFWIVLCFFFYRTRNNAITLKQAIGAVSVIALVSVILRFYYAFSFDQEFYSDFRAYWDIASDMVENGFKPATNIYVQRSLAFNYPLIYVFGNSDTVFKVANVILVTFSGMIAAFVAGRWISYSASIATFSIYSVIPETYYALLIPSHDITGTFYFIICFALFFIGLEKARNQKYRSAVVSVVLMSVFLIPMEMQRGLYPVFMATLIFSMLIYCALSYQNFNGFGSFFKKIGYPVFIVLSLPCIIFSVWSGLAMGTLLFPGSLERQVIRFNTLNTGNKYSQIDYLEKNFVNTIPDIMQRSDFRKSLFLSDLYYDPWERPGNYRKRSKRLYDLSSQLGFYMGRLKGISDQALTRQLIICENINRNFYIVFLSVLIITSCYAMFALKNHNLVAMTALIFMSISSFALLTIGENQPRYLFMGYCLWPIFMCGVLYSMFAGNPSLDAQSKQWQILQVNSGLYTFYAILFVIIIAMAGYGIFSAKFKTSNLRMLNLSDFNDIACSKSIEKQVCRQGMINFDKSVTDRKWGLLQLQLPGSPKPKDFIRTEYSYHVDNNSRYSFGVYVQQPYKSEDEHAGSFDIVISANEKRKLLNLKNADMQKYVLLENIQPENGIITVSFAVKCKKCRSTPSWQRASLTNFRFARLYTVE